MSTAPTASTGADRDRKHLVSDALRTELAREVREKGIVLWLDSQNQYTKLVDELGEFPYPVVKFRGSHLELMLALESFGTKPDPEHVLVHLPGLSKQSIVDTPVFELYKAGKSYEKNLRTLVEQASLGKALPEELKEFLSAGEVTLESADAWLAEPRTVAEVDDVDRYLGGRTAEGILTDALRNEGQLVRLFEKPNDAADSGKRVLEYLRAKLGMTNPWIEAFGVPTPERVDDILVNVAGWLMCVEFVKDLTEAPEDPALVDLLDVSSTVVKTCRELVTLLRDRFPKDYERLSDDLAQRLPEKERSEHDASALGSIDTFRWEEQKVRGAALTALEARDWNGALAYAGERTREKCFWVRGNAPCRRVWKLIQFAARAGKELVDAKGGLKGCASLDEAMERYAAKLYRADQLHRRFEQEILSLSVEEIEADRLRNAKGELRSAYREWADQLTRDFNELCAERGALPTRDAQQRNVYDQVVHPSLGQGKVAYFMVDAMRYELAEELSRTLKGRKFAVQLKARLAELPTVTIVGMNALAPVVSSGRLQLLTDGSKLAGFHSGELAVRSPAQRISAMSTRSGPGTVVDLELLEVTALPPEALKRKVGGKARLIVVRSTELDDAGEKGFHLGTIADTMTKVADAVQLLHAAGIEQFVLTADHGFLLQDETAEQLDYGANMRQPDRRHVLGKEPSGRGDAIDVRLSSLGYDVDEDGYLTFCRTTAVWKTKEKRAPFVHGGNSLQERVIPVLTVERTARRGKVTAHYEVVATPQPAELGRQRLSVQVRLQRENTASIDFYGPKHVALALRAHERPDVITRLVSVEPPGKLDDGRLAVPPHTGAVLVEFELEGAIDERVQMEIYHPDGTESIVPKVVQGFFQSFRNKRVQPSQAPSPNDVTASNEAGAASSGPPIDVAEAVQRVSGKPPPTGRGTDWRDQIADARYVKMCEVLATGVTVNEVDLAQLFGSTRQVRIFSRHYEEIVAKFPFEVEVQTINGLKTYVKKG